VWLPRFYSLTEVSAQRRKRSTRVRPARCVPARLDGQPRPGSEALAGGRSTTARSDRSGASARLSRLERS